MSTITKEWLQQKIADMEAARDEIPFGLDEDDSNTLAALRIALASLEVEPVAYMYKDNLHADARFSLHTRFGNWSQEDINEYEITEIPLYTTPPAPANAEPVAWLWSHRQHLSEVSLVRPEDDERAEGAHWSGWSCQALYAAPPAPVSVPDAMDGHGGVCCEVSYADGWNSCLAAMLQGAEPVSNRDELPDGWVACSERMPEDEQEVITHNIFGYRHVSFFDEYSGNFFNRLDGSPVDCVEHVLVSHWMPLPAAPQQEVK
ncbi:DUF551 domain-containing protein [Enterobacter hormaechei]|nr:DUF551 domain-containing protein [Enterobacter hormaechei]